MVESRNMAVRETVQLRDPRLKVRNVKVLDVNSKKVKQVIQDLIDTMRENQLIGVAAPQIGENYQIFVTEPRKTPDRAEICDQLRVYVNPNITKFSQETVVIYEGCGSVVHGQLFGPVRRPKEITIEALNDKGERFHLRCDGILARVVHHEYDHLRGIEFMEKIEDYRKLMYVDYYRENVRNSPEQLKAAVITVCEVEDNI